MSVYEEIEIEDMTFNEKTKTYSYPCPCGDKFVISLDDLLDGEDIAHCPSCTLKIRIIYDEESLPDYDDDDDDDDDYDQSQANKDGKR